MKRIGIDARFFGYAGKGLGRYTQKLIENLEKIDKDNQYFVFMRKENYDEYDPKNINFHKVLADFRWYTFSEQILFPLLLLKFELDLVHFPHFNVPLAYRKKMVVTIHDLILIHFPTIKNTTLNPLIYGLKFAAYRLVIGSAIRRAERIIAVSKFTKNDILQNYSIEEKKISVIYEACENFCFFSHQKDRQTLDKYGIIKPYILYVGNAYPHKNLERLLEAFRSRGEALNGLRLVLVGKEDYFYARLKAFALENEIEGVIFAGFVPDAELDIVYKNCLAYIFPSLYEGFGLPPLEAMAKGAPVLSADHECMREILGDSAFFFEAKDVSSIRLSIQKIFEDEKLRGSLIDMGYKRTCLYSWERMANKTFDTYGKILS